MARALLLTVGTGDAANLESSLFTPLTLSINRGEWSRVVLLPSSVTGIAAEALRQRLQNPAIAVSALPEPGAENNPDACFDHFDQVIERLLAAGFEPAGLAVDFTRGTKAMSAALVLAAVRHGVPRLRYIGSDTRDRRGTVIAGTERLFETSTTRATARQRIDLARGLVEHAAFGAACALLPDPESPLAALAWDSAGRDVLRAIRPLISWLAAWDRLDYAAAVTTALPPSDSLPPAWRRHHPPETVRSFLARLDATPRSHRLIAIDLLANAARRVAQGQYEDALVRAYNVIERIARARLEDLGGKARGREEAVDKLDGLRDPMAATLRGFDRAHPSLKSSSRNDSILIHGVVAQGSRNPAEWQRLLASVETLLRRDAALCNASAALDRDLVAARFPATWSVA
ncbi:MAG: hypothetical protein ACREFO_19540 [Acetobacteraceae bacterium]